MKKVDLHVHSSFSDGTMTPSEIIIQAKAEGIAAVALTDHDTIAGLDEFYNSGMEHGVETLTGIEISATHAKTSMHILGYGFQPDNADLYQKISVLQDARVVRNQEIFARLQHLGHNLSLDDISPTDNGQIGRPHIAALLIKKGIVRTFNEAFYRFLRKDGPAYAPKKDFPAAIAIEMITKAGGVTILAHPGSMDPSLKSIPALIAELKELGLCGIEALYPSHPPKNQQKLTELAKQHHLIITGGSDFHGAIKPKNPLGQSGQKAHIPYELFEELTKKINNIISPA